MVVKALRRALIVLVVLCASGLLALVYRAEMPGNAGPDKALSSGNGGNGAPQEAALGQFTPLDPPRPAPALTFTGRDGTPRSLADFRGRWVLVNLWATWCAPCVREMPSLDRLQAALGTRLAIVAISEDRGAAPVVDPFLEKLGLKQLAIYLDPKGAAGQALKARGLPTSVLIDGEGRMVGMLEGAAEWDSPKMRATLERYLGQPAAPSGVVKTSATR
jgi:thiol-disulfide isomerase/thioredoxin